jgi:NAD(P)-dependent dehydrogenase (short-subunit alcohol dehydrogenase family)
MITLDLRGTGVIVTGGTSGLGKAIGLEFARTGATVFLTHRWGSADEEAVAAEFARESLPAPHIVESDASDAEASRALMAFARSQVDSLHAVISNVAFAKIVHDIGDLRRSALELSLGYSAWPVVDLVQAAHAEFGTYPRYVIGVSSDGAEVCHEGYDLAGASKAVLETLCRYLALRLRVHGVRVNAIRPGFLDTASSRATFGDAVIEAARERVGSIFLEPRVVARSCVALASGLLDAVTGQVITVDEGWSLVSPLAFLAGPATNGSAPAPGDAGLPNGAHPPGTATAR